MLHDDLREEIASMKGNIAYYETLLNYGKLSNQEEKFLDEYKCILSCEEKLYDDYNGVFEDEDIPMSEKKTREEGFAAKAWNKLFDEEGGYKPEKFHQINSSIVNDIKKIYGHIKENKIDYLDKEISEPDEYKENIQESYDISNISELEYTFLIMRYFIYNDIYTEYIKMCELIYSHMSDYQSEIDDIVKNLFDTFDIEKIIEG